MADIPKVRPGERLRAPTVNAVIERVNDLPPPPGARQVLVNEDDSGGTADNLVRIANKTGQHLARYAVVSLRKLASAPRNAPLFEAVKPDGEKRHAILVEPVRQDRTGFALVYGQCVCRVDIKDTAHRHADVIEGDPEKLESAADGPFVLLHTPDATGECETRVRFPAGGGGGKAWRLGITRGSGIQGRQAGNFVEMLPNLDANPVPNSRRAAAVDGYYLNGIPPLE